MGDIHRVTGVSAASLGGSPESKVSRQDDPRKQGTPHRDPSSLDDVVELHDNLESSEDLGPPPTSPAVEDHLDLTA
jgi:hypothetical protein